MSNPPAHILDATEARRLQHPLFVSRGKSLGLIAGNGVFPIEVARRARELGHRVVAIAHQGETKKEIEALSDVVEWVRVGQLGRILKILTRHKVDYATLAGGISRVRIFSGARPDLAALKLVARVGSVRDDKILRALAGEIEGLGIEVIGASMLLDRCLAPGGYLSSRTLTPQEAADARLGWEVAREIGRLDIGQAVVVFRGVVVAVEGIEGTDGLIRRSGELTRRQDGGVLVNRWRAVTQSSEGGGSPVVVKVTKPQQDQRLDLPTIGEGTLASMHHAGAGALVIEAGKTLLLDPEAVRRLADQLGISILAIQDPSALGTSPA